MILSNFANDIKKLDGYESWRDCNGYCLDKDTIVPGNKEYFPIRCHFIPYTENIREANKRTESIKAAQESNKTVYYLKKDSVTLVFDSESAACKYLGVKKCSVSSCRRRNRRCKGYTVSCAKMEVEGMSNARTKAVPVLRGYVHLDEAYSYFRDFVLCCDGCDMVFTLDSICITKEELIEAWNQRVQ